MLTYKGFNLQEDNDSKWFTGEGWVAQHEDFDYCVDTGASHPCFSAKTLDDLQRQIDEWEVDNG